MVNKIQKYRNKIIQYNILRVLLMLLLWVLVSFGGEVEPDAVDEICKILAVLMTFDFMLFFFSEQYYKILNK
ncbi:TPA: hypothetical protein OMT91_004455 [Enterobacter hormaechei]|nr:hypothetical protein [Salmonella enterica]HCR0985548.1 hypothetical protein [Enterobacter hormaechei]